MKRIRAAALSLTARCLAAFSGICYRANTFLKNSRISAQDSLSALGS